MPVKGGLLDRPASVQSGEPLVALERKIVVQRRSDMMLKKQTENIQDAQKELRTLLGNLDQARTQADVEYYRTEADHLKEYCDQMVLVLKIASKIHVELSYARTALDKAIKAGGDINMARKRVRWLEDRMEQLLSKAQQGSPRTDVGVATDAALVLAERNVVELDTRCEPSDSTQCTAEDEGTDTEGRGNEGKMKVPSDKSQDPPITEGRGSVSLDHGDTTGNERGNNSSVSSKGKSNRSGRRSSSSSSSSVSSSSKDKGSHSSRISSRSSSSSDGSQTAADGDNGLQKRRAFITETPERVELETLSKKRRGSHVTIRSPSPERGELSTARAAHPEVPYWESEHHRFQLSDYAAALLGQDPLSYHQLGLALPDSFVKDVAAGKGLPWRPKSSATAVTDIHKRALDKLDSRVHRMYGKVQEASMLSVNQTAKEEFVRPTLGRNHEVISSDEEEEKVKVVAVREETAAAPGMPAVTRRVPPQPNTQETVTFPPLDKERLGSSLPGRLIYYPAPLPPPEKLPVTTTNRKKVFPRDSGFYSDSKPGDEPPAERIVNQRNLLAETKFTSSLFRAKPAPRGEANTSEERRRQDLLAQRTPSLKSVSEGVKMTDVKKGFAMVKKAMKLKDEREDTPVSGRSTAFSLLSVQSGASKWNDMKPKSGYLDHSGLKWERIKSIVHDSLVSDHTEERVDAARQLGVLRCCDPMVLYALRDTLQTDEDTRVIYEATKALISLGCWDEEILSSLVLFLEGGNSDMRADLLQTMLAGKNAQYVDKRLPSFHELRLFLSFLTLTEDPDDETAFQAAVCLGRLCVADDQAVSKLRQVVECSQDTHKKAQALEILVRQLHQSDPEIVQTVLQQLRSSAVWKHRKEAAKHLIVIGKRALGVDSTMTDQVYDLLEKKLWDDPNKDVRHEAAKALASLELFARACETVERKLSDPKEEIRAQAAICIGSLGMKSDRIIRKLLEMVELDSSDYVRLMIIRNFGVLNCHHRRVLQMLADKEKGDGPLSREARKTLQLVTTNGSATKNTKTRQ